jgi:hypothetical protein
MPTRMIAIFCLLPLGCTAERTDSSAQQGPNPAKEAEQAQRAKLLEIAAKYKTYTKVDGRLRFAPAFCRPPDPPGPEYRLSRSEDEDTHGRKLYTLYALKREPGPGSYVRQTKPNDALEPVTGQVVVKESWHCAALRPNEKWPASAVAATGSDGQSYRKTDQGPLFVMYQTDPQDPHADAGWVYGTLTPDGQTVTGVGRLENCMKCHQKAPHGRLFGLPVE